MTDTQTLLENRPPSVATLFLERVAATPDKDAYLYPVPAESGEGPDGWKALTWGEAAGRVNAIAAGLMDLGVRPEERVALAANTSVTWILADLGVLCAGAATTTVYPSTNADETAFILADSGSRVLFAEDAAQLAKALQRRADLPELRHVVVFDPDYTVDATDGDGWVLSLEELEKRGAAYLESHPSAVTDAVGALTKDQLATLIYTSGTTGRPKGVRLPHDAWAYMARAIQAVGLLDENDVQYLWLPLAHVFGKVLTAGHITVGHVTAVDGRVDKIIENLPAVRPTYMAAVPRIFEKVYNGVAARARAGGAAKYRIFQWAAEVARQYAKATQDSMRLTGTASAPMSLRSKHALADKLVYGKLREAFGGRLRACVSGSAALAPEIGLFFAGAGIHILEGYGLTESSAASFVNPGEAYRTGTVGKALPGLEVRIAEEDGEILLRGPGIMQGYHGLPEKTAEVLEPDGWFHTGDIGELSSDGFLKITDRKKDLIKSSNGKYIAPAEVEGRFKAACPFVSNVLVVGGGRSFCTALLALDEPTILAWAAENGLEGRPYAEVVASDQVRELIDGYVRDVNEGLQRWEKVRQFRVLPRDLDVEHGDLTPSLKLKRPVVEKEFAPLIEEMYAGSREA